MSASASNGIFLNTLGLTTWLFETTPMVLPSGARLDERRVPVMPPAPGRFSITTGWPPSALRQRRRGGAHDGVDARAGADRQDHAQRLVRRLRAAAERRDAGSAARRRRGAASAAWMRMSHVVCLRDFLVVMSVQAARAGSAGGRGSRRCARRRAAAAGARRAGGRPSVSGSSTTSVVPPSSVCIGTRPPLSLQVRVVDQLLGPHDRRVGNAGGLELGRRARRCDGARRISPSLREQLGPHGHAQRVGRERRVARAARALEHAAQRHELLVADRADEELLAVGQREHVVDAPRRDARGHRRRRLAGHQELLHVLRRRGTRSSRTARSAPPGRGRCARARAARPARRWRRTCRP